MQLEIAQSLGCTLDELGDRISSEEYSIRTFVRPPDGDRTVARLLAMLAAITFNIHRPKDAVPMKVDELLPPILRAEKPPEGPTRFDDVQAFLAELQ